MLVGLGDMKTYLGLDPDVETADDDFLTQQIELISQAIEAYCRRSFLTATYEQTFYSDDYCVSKELQTFQFPVQEVASVEQDGVAVTDFRLHKPTGILTRKGGFFYGLETVVTYTAGYDEVPAPVTNAVYSLVEERYNKKKSGVNLNFGSDVQRISIPGTISVDFDYSLSNNDRSNSFGLILGPHLNSLDYYRSERAIVGQSKLEYVEET